MARRTHLKYIITHTHTHTHTHTLSSVHWIFRASDTQLVKLTWNLVFREFVNFSSSSASLTSLCECMYTCVKKEEVKREREEIETWILSEGQVQKGERQTRVRLKKVTGCVVTEGCDAAVYHVGHPHDIQGVCIQECQNWSCFTCAHVVWLHES